MEEAADSVEAAVAELRAALQQLAAATQSAWSTGVPEEALANATPYLQAFGHVVLAWMWSGTTNVNGTLVRDFFVRTADGWKFKRIKVTYNRMDPLEGGFGPAFQP